MCVHRANVGAGGKPRCITPPVQAAQGRPLVMVLPRAGVNNWLVVMGGRTAELGWFGTRTDTFHNDVALVNCEAGALQWRTPPIAGEPPIPREFPTLAALSGGRLLLFGGDLPCSFVNIFPHLYTDSQHAMYCRLRNVKPLLWTTFHVFVLWGRMPCRRGIVNPTPLRRRRRL
jgi:hypothetical protein